MHPFGVHSHLFRGAPAAVADALVRHGLTCVQLSPGFPGLGFHEPGQITPERCRRAAAPFHERGVRVVALTMPAPLLEPDLERRHPSIMRWHALIRHCRHFGTDQVVAETGSLSPRNPWAPHPPNQSAEAWTELTLILREALRLAADCGVTLLLKPDSTHVLASADDAVRLHEEFDAAPLGFVLDPASFLLESRREDLDAELERLVRLVGPWAPLVHAKDLRFGSHGPSTPRAGLGVLDYGRVCQLLSRRQLTPPIILEHLQPRDVVATKAVLDRALLKLYSQAPVGLGET